MDLDEDLDQFLSEEEWLSLGVRAHLRDDGEGQTTRRWSLGGRLVRATDGQKSKLGESRFIASTGNPVRNGDVLDQRSFQIETFNTTNPVILWEHGLPVVGRGVARKRRSEDLGAHLRVKVAWDMAESNPQGIQAAEQHHNGFRHAVSVSFLPGKTTSRTRLKEDHPFFVDPETTHAWMAGFFFHSSELLEISTVSVPMDPGATQIRAYHSMLQHYEADDPSDPTGDPERLEQFYREWMSGNHAEILVAAMEGADEDLRTRLRTALLAGTPADEPEPDPVDSDGVGALLDQLEWSP